MTITCHSDLILTGCVYHRPIGSAARKHQRCGSQLATVVASLALLVFNCCVALLSDKGGIVQAVSFSLFQASFLLEWYPAILLNLSEVLVSFGALIGYRLSLLRCNSVPSRPYTWVRCHGCTLCLKRTGVGGTPTSLLACGQHNFFCKWQASSQSLQIAMLQWLTEKSVNGPVSHACKVSVRLTIYNAVSGGIAQIQRNHTD